MKKRRVASPILPPAQVASFVEGLFHDDLHAKRVRSLSDATMGAIHAAAIGVHAIGRGLATAKGLIDKHAVKQVDRMLGNPAIDVDALFASWVPHVLKGTEEVMVNLDWTEFAKDKQSMLVLAIQTGRGRSTPLLWKTVASDGLKGNRNKHEDTLLLRLAELLPDGVAATIVADRGFGDHKLYDLLTSLGLGFIIRFRQGIAVTNHKGEQRSAGEWVGAGGRARVLRKASVTKLERPVATVICVQDPGMKDAWCLASNDPKLTAKKARAVYGHRFTIEEMFRDVKDMRFGMGMAWQRVGTPERRDRLMLITALAQGLLILLGLAGEKVGFDRYLKTNTSKKRTISLLRMGVMWYERMGAMPDDRLEVLMQEFGSLMLQNHPFAALVAGE